MATQIAITPAAAKSPSPTRYMQSPSQPGSNNVSPTSTNFSNNTNLTTPNTSPQAVHSFLPNAPRQLNAPKSPLYRPAALRTTEWAKLAAKGSPLVDSTTTASLETAVDDIVGTGNDSECTGPPGRGHWKPDAEATECDAPFCSQRFTLLQRRHHCRHCGNIFCAKHAPHMLPLDQNNRFNSKGYECRVCDTCNKEYKKLCALAKSSRNGSLAGQGKAVDTPSPIDGKARPATGGLKGRIGSYVGSVPRDWSWSTF